MTPINNIIRDLVRDVERRSQSLQLRDIAADPKAHKLTLLMGERGSNYRYVPAGKDGRGWEVRYCWSCWRNAAGYFLGWREVIPPKGSTAKHAGKRDQWIARKVRKRAEALALARAERFKASRA